MKNYALAATALTFAAGAATAGGIQRAKDQSQILFEEGKNYLEFSASIVAPSLSGTPTATPAPTTGNILEDFQNYSAGYKRQINESLAFAVYANEPVGANVDYAPGTGAPFAGSSADVASLAVTGLLKYDFTKNVSAYGGLRVQSLSGNVSIRGGLGVIPDFDLTVAKDYRVGYVLGAAYQVPDIALKFALTYESAIEHTFTDSNTGGEFDVEIPQSLTLHAQSGVAKDTIVFGSVRWQDWTGFEIAPPGFLGGAVPIASEPSDIFTYELGVGRKFTDNWSGAFTIAYEVDQGDIVGNLSARDGFISYGVAAKYETEAWEITAGVSYIDLGDATTTAVATNFSGGDAIAAGVKLGFRF